MGALLHRMGVTGGCTGRWLVVLATLAAGTALALSALHFPPLYGTDDAMITQVYARNIAEGHGYVYFPGGERVEGSTSFLWTMACALLFMVSAQAQPLVLVLSVLLAGAAIAGMVRIVTLLARGERYLAAAAWAGAALVALDLNFFAWSVWSLMDGVLYTAIVTWLAVQAMELGDDPSPRRIALLAGLSSLAPLARPEGIAVAFGLGIAMALVSLLAANRKAALGFAVAALAALASFAALTAGRLSYFGWPFPNTYYAKVSEDHMATIAKGLHYLAWGLWQMPLLTPALALAGVLAWQAGRRWVAARSPAGHEREIALLLAGAAVVASVVIEGGDHFHGARQFQTMAPLAAALVGMAMERAMRKLPPRAGALAVVVAFAAILSARVLYWRLDMSIQREFTVAGEARWAGEAMTALAGQAGGAPSIGVIAAGGTPWTYRGPVYDLVGLNWTRMAHAASVKQGAPGHESFDPAIVLAAQPDVLHILRQDRNGPVVSLWLRAVTKGLPESATFRAAYAPVRFDFAGGRFFFFASQRWLAAHPAAPLHRYRWDEVQLADDWYD